MKALTTQKMLAAAAKSRAPAGSSWDLSLATFSGGDHGLYEPVGLLIDGVHLSPDGFMMYIVNQTTNAVSQYALGTAWVLSTGTFVRSVSFQAQDTNMEDVWFKPDGMRMYLVGSTNNSVYEYTLSTAWDVSTATFSHSLAIPWMKSLNSITFKSDGAEFIVAAGSKMWIGYKLATPWDLSTASFNIRTGATTGGFAYVGYEETTPVGMYWKPDGTKVYVTGYSGDDVNEYTLTTPWDMLTISFTQNFSVAAQDTSPHGVFFDTTGTIMYVLGNGTDSVYEYGLATAWDVSTASYSTKSFSVATQLTNPQDIFFRSDGRKMYVSGSSPNILCEYDLSTAWDLSTTTLNQTFTLPSSYGTGIFFKPDGAKAYICAERYDYSRVYEYNLPTAWDISTLAFVQVIEITNVGDPNYLHGVTFDSSGTRMYTLHDLVDGIQGWTLGFAWDIGSVTSDVSENFYINSTPFQSKGKISPDGTVMIWRDEAYTRIRRRVLTTAWDVSTAGSETASLTPMSDSWWGIYLRDGGNQIFLAADGIGWSGVTSYTMTGGTWDVSTATYDYPASSYKYVRPETQTPGGVAFKPDGLRMYVSGDVPEAVHEYWLSTAWDITTATYQRSGPNIIAQEPYPRALAFSTDGDKVFIVGWGNNNVNEYSLSTPWDISTMSFVQAFSSGSSSRTHGLYFKSDGKTMFTSTGSLTAAAIREYTLTTAWDLSTASQTQSISLWYSAQSPDGVLNEQQSVFFKPDGTKMFVSAGDNVPIYAEFSLSTAWDITSASRTLTIGFAGVIPTDLYGVVWRPDGTQFFATVDTNSYLEGIYAFDIV